MRLSVNHCSSSRIYAGRSHIMQRFIVFVVFGAILLGGISSVFAKTDAEAAFDAGKLAYQAGQFEKARDEFLKATRTVKPNPEAFLWLGKSYFQLGKLEKAISAWKKTLSLVPNEPYATKMLKALRGETLNAEARIALTRRLIDNRMPHEATVQCFYLLTDKALTDKQRADVLTLNARADLKLGKSKKVIARILEIRTKYPKLANEAELSLLTGQAKMQMGGKNVSEGIASLKNVIARFPKTPQAVSARYELILFDISQSLTAGRVEALAKWVTANPEHSNAHQARYHLINHYQALVTKTATPAATELGKFDKLALAVAADIYKRIPTATEADQLTRNILAHFEQRHYSYLKSPEVAIAGVEALLKIRLVPSSRLRALRTLVRYRAGRAIKVLARQARAGKLSKGAMPKILADALDTYAMLNRESPERYAWANQAHFAERVLELAGQLDRRSWIDTSGGPVRWAQDIALEVIKANRDKSAVSEAVKIVSSIRDGFLRYKSPKRFTRALKVSTRLLSVMDLKNPQWRRTMWRHAEICSLQASHLFDENVKNGRANQNAKLSLPQKHMLVTITPILERYATRDVSTALRKLSSHLEKWIAAGHYVAAEKAYDILTPALPDARKKDVRLIVAGLWIRQVKTEHRRLQLAGLKVPQTLDPQLVRALKRCYELQAGLKETDPFLSRVRRVWRIIVNHYSSLEYYSTANAAIMVKAAKPVPQADRFAHFALADQKLASANRELQRLLKKYNGKDRIAFGPSFRAAVASYENFIRAYPSDSLRSAAVNRILHIAQTFARYEAFDASVEVYRRMAEFGKKVPVLSQAAPGSVSISEHAEYLATGALDLKARQALSKQLKDRKDKKVSPKKLSEEFTAAIGAYRAFIKARSKSPLIGSVGMKIMQIGLLYAQADAWGVAEGVYAGILAGGLELHRPERLEFCRGLCQLGRVMPTHARDILRTLSSQSHRPVGKFRKIDELRKLTDELAADVDGEKDDCWGGGDDSSGSWGASADEGISSRLVRDRRRDKLEEMERLNKKLAERFRRRGGQVVYSEASTPKPSVAPDNFKTPKSEMLAMASIRRQQALRATQIARLRDKRRYELGQSKSYRSRQRRIPSRPVLSDAEISRREKAFAAAYGIFQGIGKKYPNSPTAPQARGEIMVMIGHWRGIRQWQRAADLSKRFQKDNPSDRELPRLKLAVARDYLSWASEPVKGNLSKQDMLAEVSRRFDKARTELRGVVKSFSKQQSLVRKAQWDIAGSYLTQARVVDNFSKTLARGQFVRAARELQKIARKYHDHPQIASIPSMLWGIANDLSGRMYYDEAMIVWNDLTTSYPTHSLASQASMRIAQTYEYNLGRPLRAAEVYHEINFARGGDMTIQNAIYNIGSRLKGEKRWVEALHVLDTFVDSYPHHPQAGHALTMIGHVHQTNQAWQDAISAYRRVINEFPAGNWVRDARWSIAQCRINLSQWREAIKAYRQYVKSYRRGFNVSQANVRIGILKDLARYQALVDEKGQRKAFDAQFQIARIVQTKLANPTKAIIEYRKVAENWPKSHLADDALFAVGTTYLSMIETDQARKALLSLAKKYPDSPLADDALFKVGQSYESEARRLRQVTRASTLLDAKDIAQKAAYKFARSRKKAQRMLRSAKGKKLREAGKMALANAFEAGSSQYNAAYDMANVMMAAKQAKQAIVTLSAAQLADRQDKLNAALRKAVTTYKRASKVAGADKAGDALLRMAVIYDENLKDSASALVTWLEIVRQFSGTAVAEDASWRIAQYYQRAGKYEKAIQAFKAFLRNYRRSAKAGAAQFAVAENHEHLGQWIKAMDAYTNYINNFPSGPMVRKAKEQINWIKTYRL